MKILSIIFFITFNILSLDCESKNLQCSGLFFEKSKSKISNSYTMDFVKVRKQQVDETNYYEITEINRNHKNYEINSDQETYFNYLNSFSSFFKKLGFSISETRIFRPGSADLQNFYIRKYNETVQSRDKINIIFWDDFTSTGSSSVDQIYKKWAYESAWPIQQVNTVIHQHDLVNHALPTMALPAEVVSRSKKNFQLLLLLRDHPMFKDDLDIQENINSILDSSLETSAEFAFKSYLNKEYSEVVWYWNNLIVSKAEVKEQVLRGYITGEKRKLILKIISEMSATLNRESARQELQNMHMRLSRVSD